MKVRAHLYIKGRVQGVGYRAFVVRTAGVFGLDGWVRNLSDRSVEAVFEGDRPSIEAAIKRLYEGSPAALVSSIDINWTDNPEGLSNFDVRY
jgi:acylphosphatase